MYPGIDPLDAAMVTPTGNAFRNAYFRNRINQVQLRGHYDHDDGFLDSIDFGVSYVDSKVRSAFGTIQNDDTWGGSRSEERRGGKECVSKCGSRCWRYI